MKRFISALLCLSILFGFASCKKKDEVFCEADSGKIKVLSLESTSGLFVEKGKQDKVKHVATIVVRNVSDKMLEYGKIVFRVNEIERAEFIVCALPAGEECVVMETTARTLAKDDVYIINMDDSMFSYCDSATEDEKYTLEIEGSTLKVKNNTDSPLTVKVAYKYYKGNRYYGGICFRGTFESIAPGETMKKKSNRFNENCKIVNVTTE